ncbi:MAG TPA: arylsulfotransferase family protein [Streptosporangiaceae bacterium]
MPEAASGSADSRQAARAPGGPGGLPRRHLLRLGGGVAAGAALLGGCAAQPESQDAAASGAAGPEVRHYKSRPGLRPAAAAIGTDTGKAAPGVILLDSHAGVGQQGPMILDNAGDLVWFRPLSAGRTPKLRAMNVRVQHYQGEPVLTWWQGSVLHGHGEGHYVLANSRYQEIARVSAHGGLSGDLHEFLITPAGTALFSSYGTATADLRSIGGVAHHPYFYGEVQEIDIATGKLVFRWRSDRHVAFRSSYAPIGHDTSVPWDQFHLNSINVAPDGNLIISARDTWTVYKIHRKTGRVMWRMGGKYSNFTMGPKARFAWQHHVTPHADGTFTVFDNEAGDYRVGKRSRALVLHVDEKRRHVSFVRQFNPPVPILTAALGSVQELPGGHVLVGWGEHPYFTEYRRDGSVVFSGHLRGKGTFDYRAFKSPWTGRPAGPPAIAATRSGSGMTVYASWNGDTRVRHWKVLAGSAAGSLAVVATARRHGFETTIPVPRHAAYVAAAGYDSGGHELGRSAAHRL